MRLFGKLEELLRLVFRKDSRNITLRPNNSTTYTADRTFDLPPGDASHVIVSETATQTLTNKTIDADNNTITNIEDADIKAGANIARNKLASGTANHVLINDASGVFSSEAQLATSRGGTGVNSTATFPTSGLVLTETNTATGANRVQNKDLDDSNVRIVDASDTSKKIAFDAGGTASTTTTIAAAQTANRTITLPDATTTLVGTDTTQTLTNKTLQQDTIDDYVDFNEETASPSTPPSGKLRVFARNDSKLYLKDSAGNELEVGSGAGGSGGRNYLLEWFDGNKNVGTTGTVAENGNVTTTQWLGSNTSPISNTTTTPLRQTQSFLTNVTSASTGGTSFVQTPRFQIDRADLGKPLTLSFDVSGLGASGEWDVIVIRYNSSGVFQERIPVAGHLSAATLAPSAQIGAGTYTFRGFFLPSSTVDDYYVVRFRRLSGSSSAIRIDSLVVGPHNIITGTPIAQGDFTPTLRGSTTNPTGVSYANRFGRWYRLGAYLYINARIRPSSWTGGSGLVVFSLDDILPGLTVSSTNFLTTGALVNQSGTWYDVSATTYHPIASAIHSSNPKLIEFWRVGTGDVPVSFSNFETNDILVFTITVPIAEWESSSSNIQLAERAVEEYASNSAGDLDADDLTSFVYGPQGSLVPRATLTGIRHRRVRFRTPILPTDTLILEFKPDGQNRWIPWSQQVDLGPNAIENAIHYTQVYGAYLLKIVNETDVDVRFARYRGTPTTYDGAGSSWSAFAGADIRWRVRKVSGGAAVGYPVSTRNIIGHLPTSSTDLPPAGYIGQIILSNTYSGFSTITASGQTFGSGANKELTVPPGTYLVFIRADAVGSDPTVYTSCNPTIISGTGQFYFTANLDGNKTADSVDTSVNWNLTVVLVATTTVTFECRSGPVYGGSFSSVRIIQLMAIRIA